MSEAFEQWAAALDHGYRHARRTSFAQTGLRSTYRIARQKCEESSEHESKRLCQRLGLP